MVLRKILAAFVFCAFLIGGVSAPVGIDVAGGLWLTEKSADAGNHKDKKEKKGKKEKKAKKEKKDKGDKASKRKNEEMEGVGKKGKGKGLEKGKRNKKSE